MVKAEEILERFKIARSTFYALVKQGVIPVHDVTKPWHRRRQLRFVLSEVEPVLKGHA